MPWQERNSWSWTAIVSLSLGICPSTNQSTSLAVLKTGHSNICIFFVPIQIWPQHDCTKIEISSRTSYLATNNDTLFLNSSNRQCMSNCCRPFPSLHKERILSLVRSLKTIFKWEWSLLFDKLLITLYYVCIYTFIQTFWSKCVSHESYEFMNCMRFSPNYTLIIICRNIQPQP